jgi:hypothetical protein
MSSTVMIRGGGTAAMRAGICSGDPGSLYLAKAWGEQVCRQL